MTIPASHYVQVIPGVVNAGGTALVMNGLFLSPSYRVPYGAVQSFASPLSVSNFFGATSPEYLAAQTYFSGFITGTKYPATMLVTQYNGATPIAAWLQSGNVSALGLPALQAITSGTLTLTVDGYPHSIASLNLSGATSFSAAAALIQAALGDPTEATFTGAQSGTTLTVSSVSSGTLSVGQTITGVGIAAGTIITALGTGTGLTGTYTVSISQSVSSESMTAVATQPTVTYDSITGAFLVTSGITGVASSMAFATGTLAATLLMTSSTGAIMSQGAAATTPSAFMNTITQVTQNWATFLTIADPDGGSGNTQKLAFAAWTNGQNNRYAYLCWDTDQSPTASSNATASLGFLIGTNGNNYSGTALISEPSGGDVSYHYAAFTAGFVASLDFTAPNGRATLAYKSQNGLLASVTNLTVANNLESNGYNYYGAAATANQTFLFMYPGSISGPFLWFDSYVNQIWLNNALQLALLNLLTQVKSIPYNQAGYAQLAAACQDPINQAITFGAIRQGVTLSQQQIATVNSTAGKTIDQTLSQQGYYLVITDPGAQARAARQSPFMVLFYMDGQSVQKIVLNSLDVQ